ncbi:MAG: GNAT family N-acetyltransferase [Ornithinimicrobium sp.]
MISRVEQPSVFVTAYVDGEPVGIGRAVTEQSWTGVFHMVTAPHARNRGIARLVLHSISQWSLLSDAPNLYLQVERSNSTASRLYTATGSKQLANYHYRVR